MTGLPVFTETDLTGWIDARSLSRGRAYYQEGTIEQPTSTVGAGATLLAAWCHGSRATPYRVQATFDEHGLVADSCTCPVGSRCKHLAALLYAWLADSAAFVAQTDLATRLAERTPAELIELIQQLIDRQPELERLLDLPTARERARPARLIPRASAGKCNKPSGRSMTKTITPLPTSPQNSIA